MSLVLKDPDAVLDYLVDWGAEYLAADDLIESTWSVEPDEAEGVAVAGQAGERFALINPGALQSIDLPLEALGSEVRVKAMGLADVDAVPVSQTASGEALRSPSPVHLSAAKTSTGDLLVRWVRRSRTGWAWLDGIDAPLGESVERYRVQVESSGGSLSVETNTPSATFAASQLSSLGVGAATIRVTQIGEYAESRPASIQITLA